MDIMYFENKEYLIIVDSYSKWLEILRLRYKTSAEIISKLKNLFSTFGIPETIISDNSPFGSYEIKIFAKNHNIDWRTSSPNYAVSNGQSERAVQVSKNILKKASSLKSDYLDLLMEYRATPIPSIGYTPSELLMGRIIKTKVMINPSNLKPIENLGKMHKEVKSKLKINQSKNKVYYDKTSREETNFENGEKVLVQENKRWIKGCIVEKTKYPRSYIVEINGKQYRRNSRFLKHFNCNNHESRKFISEKVVESVHPEAQL